MLNYANKKNNKAIITLPSFFAFYKYILIFHIAFQIIYNSLWKIVYPNRIWLYLYFSSFFILFIMILIQFFLNKFSLKEWLYFLFIFILSILGLKFANVMILTIILYAMYVFFLNYQEVISVFLKGTFIGFFSVILLAFGNFLPMYESIKGYLTFGFRNPNTTGYYALILAIGYIVTKWYKPNKRMWFFYAIVIIFEIYFMKDSTALVMALIFLILYVVLKNKPNIFKNLIIRVTTCLLPILLTIISFYLALTERSSNILRWNDLFTNRLNIWHYYAQNYPPQLLPQKIIPFAGWIDNVPGHNAFDGAYIYFPVYNGYLFFSIFLVLLCLFLWKCLKNQRYDLLAIAITIIISGFSENLIFSAYQSPVIVMAVAFSNRLFVNTNIKRDEPL